MKKFVLPLVGIALTATGVAASAQSVFGRLREAARDVEETAESAGNAAQTAEALANGRVSTGGRGNGYPTVAASSANAGRAGPAPAELVAMTNCAGVPISNAMIGQLGDYTFQEGLQTEERSGLINRESVEASQDCIMPSMGTYDALYLEVPTARFEAMGNSNDWELQCVESSTRSAAVDPSPSVGNLTGKDIMLYCGNSEGVEDCATGSNSTRSGAWDDSLERRGMTMLSFNMPAFHQDSGTDMYCQYYNRPSGTSLLAFQWRRSAGE